MMTPTIAALERQLATLRRQRDATRDPKLIQYYNDEIIRLRLQLAAERQGRR